MGKTARKQKTPTAHQKMVIEFWGVRGTLPVPSKKTTRYGGNTNCVTLTFDKDFFIFDAGTGIKALSNYLIQQKKFPISAKIFISHPHYDHISGIPVFAPLYMPGNKFEILGSRHHNMTIDQLIAGQMDTIYFPITIKEFSANLTFRNLQPEESFILGELQIQTTILNHPGDCIGYRVQHQDKSFCYVTDNELLLENSPHYQQADVDRLIAFLHNADLLVIDSTYSDEEYIKKVGWGHSCISRVVDVADKAQVKLLCLYHHDPDQFDHDIDLKLKHAKQLLKSRRSKTRCIAPHEGQKIII